MLVLDLKAASITVIQPFPAGAQILSLSRQSYRNNSDVPAEIDPMAVPVKQGFALASVLLVIVVISITVVPLMDMVMRNRSVVASARIVSHLQQEAREAMELSLYQVKLAKGFPAHFLTGVATESRRIADICYSRIVTVDDEFLGDNRLSDEKVRKTKVSASNNRQTASFVIQKPPNSQIKYTRYVVVSCVVAEAGQVGIYATEIAFVGNNFHVLKSGQF